LSSGSPNQQSPTAIEPQPGISALLLTIGEPTTAEAHQALQNQTLPLQQISIIKNERPFSSAFNLGVSSIESEFFIQCDADMILDPNCAEVLLSRMNDQTGMVVAYLRDPLQGKVRGVKLYRTACCKKYPFENHLDCEDMFRKRLLQNHWNVEIIKNDRTLGKHAPDANDSIYQFERFKHMGAKIAARKAWFDLAYRLNQLGRAQDQQIVPLAVSAMICGFYIVKNEDLDVFVASP
jgi:hypothetical protein